MKRTLIAAVLVLFISCSKSDSPSPSSGAAPCGTYNGHPLYKGSQGGCYYKKTNGEKVYVDRSHCTC